MSTAISRKTQLTLLLLACLASLALGMASGPASAKASVSNYCGGWLGASKQCVGAGRYLYQTYGWGDQGPVCVSITYHMGPTCSARAGDGVYSGKLPVNVYSGPWIQNPTGGANYVHGIALTY